MSNDHDEIEDGEDAKFGEALEIAEKHLDKAITEAGALGPFVAVAMIEAAVNAALDQAADEDVIDMLRDLADQIEADADSDSEEE
ncbi:conserved hypothetical protein [uncultured Gammaproteobacteria bacterium]